MYVRKMLQRKRRSDLDGTHDDDNAWRMPEEPRRAHDVSKSVEDVTSSDGQPLDDAARSYMEPRFGHDFSQVRIHADDQAAASASSLNAAAYTAGDHVVFGRGRYQPEANSGRELLGHELTHVIQQSSGAVAESHSGPTVLDDPGLEHDADVGGARVAAGKALPTSDAVPGETGSASVQRQTIQAARLEEGEEGGVAAIGGSESESESTATAVVESEHPSANGGVAESTPVADGSPSSAEESGGVMPRDVEQTAQGTAVEGGQDEERNTSDAGQQEEREDAANPG